jgi:hypothetical protein
VLLLVVDQDEKAAIVVVERKLAQPSRSAPMTVNRTFDITLAKSLGVATADVAHTRSGPQRRAGLHPLRDLLETSDDPECQQCSAVRLSRSSKMDVNRLAPKMLQTPTA